MASTNLPLEVYISAVRFLNQQLLRPVSYRRGVAGDKANMRVHAGRRLPEKILRRQRAQRSGLWEHARNDARTHTHESQWEKNKLSFLIFHALHHADVMDTLMRVARSLKAAVLLSPSCKPIVLKSDTHVDADDAMVILPVARDQAREKRRQKEVACDNVTTRPRRR